MPNIRPLLPLSLALTALYLFDPSLAAQKGADQFWPQWRGPKMSGVSATATPPTAWSESKNIRWKVEIPGRGSASPVVWGDRVYVLSAVPVAKDVTDPHAPRGGLPVRGSHRFAVMALDRKTGKVVWEQTAREAEPHEAAHNDNGTWASSSALTDGEHIIAPFESQGLYAYDMSGKLIRTLISSREINPEETEFEFNISDGYIKDKRLSNLSE